MTNQSWVEQDNVCPAGQHYLDQSNQVNDIAFGIMGVIAEHFGAYYQHDLQPGKHIFNITNSNGTHRPVERADFDANRAKSLADVVGLLATEFPRDFERARDITRNLTDGFAYSSEDVIWHRQFKEYLDSVVKGGGHQQRRADVEPHYNTANTLAHLACYGYSNLAVGGRENSIPRLLVHAAMRVKNSRHAEELFGSDAKQMNTLAILEKLVEFAIAPYTISEPGFPIKIGFFAKYTIPRLRIMVDPAPLSLAGSSFSAYLTKAGNAMEQHQKDLARIAIPIGNLLDTRKIRFRREGVVTINPHLGLF